MNRTHRILITRTLAFAFLASTLYAVHPTDGPRKMDLPTSVQVATQ